MLLPPPSEFFLHCLAFTFVDFVFDMLTNFSNHKKKKKYVKNQNHFHQNTFCRQKEKKEETVQEKAVKERKKVDDKNRHKPYGLTAWAPVDDVYMVRHYPRPVYETSVAIEMLKNFQKLDFSPENQPVYTNLRLDMKLEKKVHFGWLFS